MRAAVNGYLILSAFLLLSCGGVPDVPEPNQWLTDLQGEFAPDKRVAVMNLELMETPAGYLLQGETNLPHVLQRLRDSFEAHELILLDSSALLEEIPALVNVSVCNIRSEPRHSAELSTQSLLGTRIRILKKQGSWYYIQTPDGYLGWLDSGAVEIPSAANLQQWSSEDKAVVIVPFDFVRSPLDNTVVSDLVEGNVLRKLGRQGRNIQVALPDGRAGVVDRSSVVDYSEFIALNEPLSENIIEKAHEFMGRPYLWGGTSGKGMDCSGFTKTVYYLNGLELPRDASQQVHVGVPVETDTTLTNLYRGDFLFFGRRATDSLPEKITHVGIYLGDGQMIHASERVRVQSLRRGDRNFAEHRLKTLVRAKRMLQNIGENGVVPLAEHPAFTDQGS